VFYQNSGEILNHITVETDFCPCSKVNVTNMQKGREYIINWEIKTKKKLSSTLVPNKESIIILQTFIQNYRITVIGNHITPNKIYWH
jgi:hypothetical protein